MSVADLSYILVAEIRFVGFEEVDEPLMGNDALAWLLLFEPHCQYSPTSSINKFWDIADLFVSIFSMMKKTPSFEDTNWSEIVKAGRDSLGSVAEEALSSLCRSYWYPIYYFARRNYQKSHEEAEDLTQGFFSSFISVGSLRTADSGKGKFRTFLLASFENFVRKEIRKQSAQKRGGDKRFVSIDFHLAHERFSEEADDSSSPSEMFDRKWAANIFDRSLQDLRSVYEEKGKLRIYDRLSSFLPGDSEGNHYKIIASELEVSEGALRVELHRMRRQFRTIVTAYVTQTVESEADVDAELRYLCQLFV